MTVHSKKDITGLRCLRFFTLDADLQFLKAISRIDSQNTFNNIKNK